MTGLIIILISATKPVAERLELGGEVSEDEADGDAGSTAAMTAG